MDCTEFDRGWEGGPDDPLEECPVETLNGGAACEHSPMLTPGELTEYVVQGFTPFETLVEFLERGNAHPSFTTL